MSYNSLLLFLAIMVATSCMRSVNISKASNFKEIIFVRHAEPNWNYSMIWQGRKDPHLTKNGLKQANLVGKQLKELCKNKNCLIFTSNTNRAKQTAEVIAETIGLKKSKLKIVEAIHERIFRDYRNPPFNITKEINQKFLSGQDAYSYLNKIELENNSMLVNSDADYETDEEFANRIKTSFNKLFLEIPPNSTPIIITHKYVFKAISKDVFNEEVSLNHAEFKLYSFN